MKLSSNFEAKDYRSAFDSNSDLTNHNLKMNDLSPLNPEQARRWRDAYVFYRETPEVFNTNNIYKQHSLNSPTFEKIALNDDFWKDEKKVKDYYQKKTDAANQDGYDWQRMYDYFYNTTNIAGGQMGDFASGWHLRNPDSYNGEYYPSSDLQFAKEYIKKRNHNLLLTEVQNSATAIMNTNHDIRVDAWRKQQQQKEKQQKFLSDPKKTKMLTDDFQTKSQVQNLFNLFKNKAYQNKEQQDLKELQDIKESQFKPEFIQNSNQEELPLSKEEYQGLNIPSIGGMRPVTQRPITSAPSNTPNSMQLKQQEQREQEQLKQQRELLKQNLLRAFASKLGDVEDKNNKRYAFSSLKRHNSTFNTAEPLDSDDYVAPKHDKFPKPLQKFELSKPDNIPTHIERPKFSMQQITDAITKQNAKKELQEQQFKHKFQEDQQQKQLKQTEIDNQEQLQKELLRIKIMKEQQQRERELAEVEQSRKKNTHYYQYSPDQDLKNWNDRKDYINQKIKEDFNRRKGTRSGGYSSSSYYSPFFFHEGGSSRRRSSGGGMGGYSSSYGGRRSSGGGGWYTKPKLNYGGGGGSYTKPKLNYGGGGYTEPKKILQGGSGYTESKEREFLGSGGLQENTNSYRGQNIDNSAQSVFNSSDELKRKYSMSQISENELENDIQNQEELVDSPKLSRKQPEQLFDNISKKQVPQRDPLILFRTQPVNYKYTSNKKRKYNALTSS